MLDDRADLDVKIRRIQDMCVIVSILAATVFLDQDQKTDLRKFVELVKRDFHMRHALNYGVHDYQPNSFIDVVEHQHFDKHRQRPLSRLNISESFSKILQRFYDGARAFGQNSIADYYRNYLLPGLSRTDEELKSGNSFAEDAGFTKEFPSKNASALGLVDDNQRDENPKELMSTFI